jgi:hypothetical protein
MRAGRFVWRIKRTLRRAGVRLSGIEAGRVALILSAASVSGLEIFQFAETAGGK